MTRNRVWQRFRRKSGENRRQMTLERALVIALALHLLGGLVVNWWPGMLYSAELAPAPEREPLQFRFVDTPDREEPPEPPDTEVLSDRDREARDRSPRDDAEDPFAEGNTRQAVLRPPPAASTPPPTPQPTPAPTPERSPPQPRVTTPQPRDTEPTERPEPAPADRQPPDAVAQPSAESPSETPPRRPLPPRPKSLSNSLARLESFVDPQMFSNPNGGVDAPQGLADFDTRGYDLGDYLRRVLVTIELNWRRNIPPLIRTRIGGATFVRLSIRREHRSGGEVAIIEIDQVWGSGQGAYDSAATFALELSSPLPPIPSFYPYETIDGRIGFVYNLDPDTITFPPEQ